MKRYKKLWLVTVLLTLVPAPVGLLLWNRLPETMATHWGADGVADGWSSKGFAVFVLPLILLAVHCLCLLITAKEGSNENQSPKALRMVFWIIPVTSWFCCGTVYFAGLGKSLEILSLMPVFMGLVFAIIGNYMPKVKQNRTLGVKLPWTFANEENWNKTHRYTGRIWVIGGLLLMLCIFLPEQQLVPVMSALIAAMVIAPVLYSFKLYRIHQSQGIVYDFKPGSKKDAKLGRISLIAVCLILTGVAVLMFTGEIEYAVKENELEIKADYWADSTVRYKEIQAVEYRQTCNFGVRTNGFGSAKLSMGAFYSGEFGSYIRYGYTQCKSSVVVISGEQILVLSASDETQTRLLYESILEKLSEENNTVHPLMHRVVFTDCFRQRRSDVPPVHRSSPSWYRSGRRFARQP